MKSGTVYTETIVHSAPEAFLSDAPYQLAIIELDQGRRVTARLAGPRVSIGDRVEYIEDRGGVPYFQKAPIQITP
jgi:uncharacterized OB-fold protein